MKWIADRKRRGASRRGRADGNALDLNAGGNARRRDDTWSATDGYLYDDTDLWFYFYWTQQDAHGHGYGPGDGGVDVGAGDGTGYTEYCCDTSCINGEGESMCCCHCEMP